MVKATLHERIEYMLARIFRKGRNPYTGRQVTRVIHADERTIAGYVESDVNVTRSNLRADLCVYEKDKNGKEIMVMYEVTHKNKITKEKREAYRDLRILAYEIVIPHAYMAYGDMSDDELEKLLRTLRPIAINAEDRYSIELPSGKTYSFREYKDTPGAVQFRAGRGRKKIMLFKYPPASETAVLYGKSGWDCYLMRGYDPTRYFGQNIDRCRIVAAV